MPSQVTWTEVRRKMDEMAFLILIGEVPKHRSNFSLVCFTYICIFFCDVIAMHSSQKHECSSIHREVPQQLCESC